MNIPEDNAISTKACRTYLEEAETLVNVSLSTISNTTDQNYIKLKRTLIKIKASILYFMNLDENFIDPNKRISKITLWTSEYNRAVEKLSDVVGSGLAIDGKGTFRRVKHSDYDSNSGTYLAE
jgi:ribosome-binding ATPase YchF (GTP1/OBG family)